VICNIFTVANIGGREVQLTAVEFDYMSAVH
jgi:hypothetical protein